MYPISVVHEIQDTMYSSTLYILVHISTLTMIWRTQYETNGPLDSRSIEELSDFIDPTPRRASI
jgi:hypothetical protein